MKKIFGVFTLICILALTGAAFAATPQAGKPVQDKPEKTVDRVTTVSVSLEGTDEHWRAPWHQAQGALQPEQPVHPQ
jgi:Protein of unknown function (DUF680).